MPRTKKSAAPSDRGRKSLSTNVGVILATLGRSMTPLQRARNRDALRASYWNARSPWIWRSHNATWFQLAPVRSTRFCW
jgi:hypothetical protein